MKLSRLIRLCGLLVFAAPSCSLTGGCKNEIVGLVQSPGAAQSAVLQERNCGATTAASMQLSIVEDGEHPPKTGNALIFSKVTADVGSYRLRWLNDHQITIDLPRGAEVYNRQSSVGSTSISINRAD